MPTQRLEVRRFLGLACGFMAWRISSGLRTMAGRMVTESEEEGAVAGVVLEAT